MCFKLFVDKHIEYAGQPVGVIAAITHAIANKAAQKVYVSYVDVAPEKLLLTIEDVLMSKDESRILQMFNSEATNKGFVTKYLF